MAENIPLRVQFKRMTADEWARSDVILLEGEIGFETDTGFAKFGDGHSRFSVLKYLTGPKGDRGEIGPQGPTGLTGPKGNTGDTGPQGPPGPTGKQGPKGDRGAKVVGGTVDSGQLTLRLDDGSQAVVEGDFRGPRGDKGEQGPPGPKGDVGPKGNDGAPGKSIAISSITEETSGSYLGSWFGSTAKSTKVTFSDGQSISLPHGKDGETGPKGDKGSDGAPGLDGPRGPIGPMGPPGKDAELPRDIVRQGQLSGYVRLADIQYQLNNIGKIKDETTGQMLSVSIVGKGQVPSDTSGMIVFERL